MRRALVLGLALLSTLLSLSCGGGDTSPDCGPPGVPTLTGPAEGETACGPDVIVQWGEVSGASRYLGQLYGQAGCSGALLSTFSPLAGSPNGVWLALEDGGRYWWRVRSQNDVCYPPADSDWSECRSFVVTTQQGPAPANPDLLHPCGEAATNAPTFSWSAVAGAERYHGLVCLTACDPVFWSRSFSVDAPETSASVALNGPGSYVWRVWAEDRSCFPYRQSSYQSCSFEVP